MTTTKIESVQIATTDNKGSGCFKFNTSGNVLSGNIDFSWNGGKISFSSVTDYFEFLSQVVLPMTDNLHSVSGSGTNFVASSAGTSGTDSVN